MPTQTGLRPGPTYNIFLLRRDRAEEQSAQNISLTFFAIRLSFLFDDELAGKRWPRGIIASTKNNSNWADSKQAIRLFEGGTIYHYYLRLFYWKDMGLSSP